MSLGQRGDEMSNDEDANANHKEGDRGQGKDIVGDVPVKIVLQEGRGCGGEGRTNQKCHRC